MAVVYDDATKEARLDATITRLGAGSKIEIGTAGMAAVLVTYTLDNPPGAAVNDTLTLDIVTSTVAATGTGTAAAARIRTSGDADRVTGLTVGTDGTDIVLDSVNITSGQNVTLSSAVITHG